MANRTQATKTKPGIGYRPGEGLIAETVYMDIKRMSGHQRARLAAILIYSNGRSLTEMSAATHLTLTERAALIDFQTASEK